MAADALSSSDLDAVAAVHAADATVADTHVRVAVQSLGGEAVACLERPLESCVLDLKGAIQCHSTARVAPVLQHLMHGEVVLKDKQTLKELGFVGTVTVTLIVKNLDVDDYIDRLLNQNGSIERADVEDMKILCAKAEEAFLREKPLLELQPPLVVAGSIHGCADQLHHIFRSSGGLEASQYLFLGNYVSRGKRPTETFVLLLLCKLKYPSSMHLLRGRQECQQVQRIDGFFEGCKRRLDVRTWKSFCQVWNSMPYAAVIQSRILCLPSGLSPELSTLDQLRELKRPAVVPDEGLVCDLLWSDFDLSIEGWRDFTDAGIGHTFGPDVLEAFLGQNSLDALICSQRQVKAVFSASNARLWSVFSASNYCGEYENQGAVLLVDEALDISAKMHDLPW
ncbi:Serine/threonine-protein phosphatase PP1-2 [Durusdinium trenchii]|uniref:Serine/threonine-protein phosphatase PP1-2 n=1 Tax=Durusdinium trenchii TaxID=1381693 RepID=A0ABP0KCD7_9DINO